MSGSIAGISNEQLAELMARGLIGGAVGAASGAGTEYARGGSILRGMKLGDIFGAAMGVLSGLSKDPRVKLATLSAVMAAALVISGKKLLKPINRKAKCVLRLFRRHVVTFFVLCSCRTVQLTLTPTVEPVPAATTVPAAATTSTL